MFISDPTATPIATQITFSAIVVAAIQWLKKSSWMPWLEEGSMKANRVAGGIFAALAAVGVHLSWSHGSLPGSYMMGVTGLTFTGVALGFWGWLKSMVFQEIIYRTTVANPPPAAGAAPAPAPAPPAVGNKP